MRRIWNTNRLNRTRTWGCWRHTPVNRNAILSLLQLRSIGRTTGNYVAKIWVSIFISSYVTNFSCLWEKSFSRQKHDENENLRFRIIIIIEEDDDYNWPRSASPKIHTKPIPFNFSSFSFMQQRRFAFAFNNLTHGPEVYHSMQAMLAEH